MSVLVIKRDGRTVPFDKEKIREAVLKAFISVDGDTTPATRIKAGEIANSIEHNVSDTVEVEKIQDMVEEKLMASHRKDVAKAYILYRNERSKRRDNKRALRRKVLEKLAASDVQNSNANMDERTFGGRMGAACSEVTKDVALNDLMSEMARNNHENNMIYTHDLDNYAVGDHNCLTIPFDDLFETGFTVKQTDVRPPQSVSTAFQQLAVIMQIQSLNQFGGVAAGHLDWTMVPFVRKSFAKHFIDGLKYINKEAPSKSKDEMCKLSIDDDFYTSNQEPYQYAMDMLEREIHQSVEALYHNLKVFGRPN